MASEGQAPEIPIERRQDDAPGHAGKEQRPEPDFPKRRSLQQIKERFELAAVPVQRVVQREGLQGIHDGCMPRVPFLLVIRGLQAQGITSYKALARALNTRGVLTANRRKWYGSTVKNLLQRVVRTQP